MNVSGVPICHPHDELRLIQGVPHRSFNVGRDRLQPPCDSAKAKMLQTIDSWVKDSHDCNYRLATLDEQSLCAARLQHFIYRSHLFLLFWAKTELKMILISYQHFTTVYNEHEENTNR